MVEDRTAIFDALIQQLECYRRLLKLAQTQRGYVQAGQTEELLEVLNKRQEELNRIMNLELTVGPVKKRWQEWTTGLSADEKAKAEGLVLQIRKMLEAITASDKLDALALQQRKLSIDREIKATSNAATVNRKYAAAAYGKPASKMDVMR
jgi:hypothetical protein